MHYNTRERKFVTVCMYCERQNFEENTWGPQESDTRMGESTISHGICPECLESVAIPQMNRAIGVKKLARKTLRFTLQNRLVALASQAS